MKTYYIPVGSTLGVICKRCKQTLEKKDLEKQVEILSDYNMHVPKCSLPIDYTINNEKVNFRCNICHNEDNFEIVTLQNIKSFY
ncbi:hypothetical protein [Clostridium butyricum]|uniref:hypothetical protein n=1 Tax=Clostridium butyricum TaxID=1492 RepID=UPI0009041FFF|nr:hypothetical protein [Clostridium butyricum]APF21422.1 hypothetical protein NPD4_3522 [Clostridium butyricum]